jgi:hypothetical protein
VEPFYACLPVLEEFRLAVTDAELLASSDGQEGVRCKSTDGAADCLRYGYIRKAAVIEHAQARKDAEPQELSAARAAVSPDAKRIALLGTHVSLQNLLLDTRHRSHGIQHNFSNHRQIRDTIFTYCLLIRLQQSKALVHRASTRTS